MRVIISFFYMWTIWSLVKKIIPLLSLSSCTFRNVLGWTSTNFSIFLASNFLMVMWVSFLIVLGMDLNHLLYFLSLEFSYGCRGFCNLRSIWLISFLMFIWLMSAQSRFLLDFIRSVCLMMVSRFLILPSLDRYFVCQARGWPLCCCPSH